MRKLLTIGTLILAIACAYSSLARAGSAEMVFWYPGEAGSTAEAQPVLDAFFDYLSKEMAPEKVSGKYFNSVKGGLDFIANRKPKAGIISFAAWTQNRARMGGAKPILATLPFPGGRVTESYTLVGAKKELHADATVYSSEPMKLDFVKAHLFSNIPSGAKLTQTERMFVKLKQLAGEENAFAILTPIEAATFKKLKTDWSKSLKVIEKSRPVPTARVIVFGQGWKDSAKFSEVLLGAGKDPAAAEILEELRLKGFGRIN